MEPTLSPVTPSSQCAESHRVRRAIALAALTLFALALRVYRLDEQSAWCDECNWFLLGTSDIGTYIDVMRFWAPDNVPLYYALFYGWTRLFGTGLVAARMSTILCGIVCIPLTFAIGHRVFDARTGWLAALCVAISPFQIWHAQSMRPYGLCLPLVLVGLYALLRIREGYWVWWVVAWVANLALLWTHVFCALLIPIQVVYLWNVRSHGLRRAVLWALAQIPVVLPPYLWLRPRLVNVWEAQFDHFFVPGLWRSVVDLVGDDVTRYSGEFPLMPAAWLTSLPGYELWDTAAGILLIALFAGLSMWAMSSAAARWRCGDGGPALLLGTAFLPVIALVALSYVWRPCVETRHTPYASILLYIVASGAIFSVRRPGIRTAMLGLLVALLAFESALFVTGVSRTEWRRAGRHIAAEQNPEDIILVKGIIHWAFDTFRANQDDRSIPVVPAHTIESICEKTAAYFDQQRPGNPAREVVGRVWAVIELPFFSPQAIEDTFAARLGPRGVEGTYISYPGMNNLLVCCFTQVGPGEPGAVRASPAPAPSTTDYEAILADMGSGGLDEATRKQAVQALRRVIDIPIPLGKNNYFTLSMIFVETGQPDLAALAAQRAIDLEPRYGTGHLALGIAHGVRGDTPQAVEAFHRAFALDPVLDALYGPLARALYETPDEQAASRQMARLAPAGFPYPALRMLFLTRFPRGSAPDPGMAATVSLPIYGPDGSGPLHLPNDVLLGKAGSRNEATRGGWSAAACARPPRKCNNPCIDPE